MPPQVPTHNSSLQAHRKGGKCETINKHGLEVEGGNLCSWQAAPPPPSNYRTHFCSISLHTATHFGRSRFTLPHFNGPLLTLPIWRNNIMMQPWLWCSKTVPSSSNCSLDWATLPPLDYKLCTRLSNCDPSARECVRLSKMELRQSTSRWGLANTQSRTKTGFCFRQERVFRAAAYLVFWLVIRLSVALEEHSAGAASDDTTFVRARNIVPLSPVGLSLNLGSKYVNSDIHKESVHSGWRNVSPSIQLNQRDNARGWSQNIETDRQR